MCNQTDMTLIMTDIFSEHVVAIPLLCFLTSIHALPVHFQDASWEQQWSYGQDLVS